MSQPPDPFRSRRTFSVSGKAHAFHTHPGCEEIIYIVEGQAEQWVETERRILGPGEVAHIPAGAVHATYNASDRPLVFLAILSPANPAPGCVDVSGDAPWRTLRCQAKQS